MPSLNASSSIAHSSAKLPLASPGARVKVGVAMLSLVMRWVESALSVA